MENVLLLWSVCVIVGCVAYKWSWQRWCQYITTGLVLFLCVYGIGQLMWYYENDIYVPPAPPPVKTMVWNYKPKELVDAQIMMLELAEPARHAVNIWLGDPGKFMVLADGGQPIAEDLYKETLVIIKFDPELYRANAFSRLVNKLAYVVLHKNGYKGGNTVCDAMAATIAGEVASEATYTKFELLEKYEIPDSPVPHSVLQEIWNTNRALAIEVAIDPARAERLVRDVALIKATN